MTVNQLINVLQDLVSSNMIKPDDIINSNINESHGSIRGIQLQCRNDKTSWMYDKCDNPFEWYVREGDTPIDRMVTLSDETYHDSLI